MSRGRLSQQQRGRYRATSPRWRQIEANAVAIIAELIAVVEILPLLALETGATAAPAAAEAHVRRPDTVDDLDVGDHVVLPGEFLAANRTRIVLDVGLVRGDVVTAEVANVCVGAMAHGAAIDVTFFHAEVAHRAFISAATGATTASRTLGFDLERIRIQIGRGCLVRLFNIASRH